MSISSYRCGLRALSSLAFLLCVSLNRIRKRQVWIAPLPFLPSFLKLNHKNLTRRRVEISTRQAHKFRGLPEPLQLLVAHIAEPTCRPSKSTSFSSLENPTDMAEAFPGRGQRGERYRLLRTNQ